MEANQGIGFSIFYDFFHFRNVSHSKEDLLLTQLGYNVNTSIGPHLPTPSTRDGEPSRQRDRLMQQHHHPYLLQKSYKLITTVQPSSQASMEMKINIFTSINEWSGVKGSAYSPATTPAIFRVAPAQPNTKELI